MIKPGDSINRPFLLKDGMVKKKSNGETYLSCTLATAEQSIPSVLWTFPEKMPDRLVGSFVMVHGIAQEYQGAAQIKISRLEVADDLTDNDKADLIPCCEVNMSKAWLYMLSTVDQIDDADYRAVATEVLHRYEEAYKNMPAAKAVHHSGIHGLLKHTSEMLCLAQSVAKIHSDVINRSLLLTGTLCHDLGKVREMHRVDCGLVNEYTTEGMLLGHPYLGMEMINEICKQLEIPENKALLLKHLIGSHSGKPEWGAIQAPQTAEAEALHLIDMMDSRMEIYREAYREMEVGQHIKLFSLGHEVHKF